MWLFFFFWGGGGGAGNLSDDYYRPFRRVEEATFELPIFVNNILVVFAGKVFQQKVGNPMGTDCAPLLADIFLFSYKAEFIYSLLLTDKKQMASRFYFTYKYISDVLSINYPNALKFIYLK